MFRIFAEVTMYYMVVTLTSVIFYYILNLIRSLLCVVILFL